jgi:predicted deacylase
MNEKKVFRKQFKSFNGREFMVTALEIKGKQPGPVLTMISGQHGMEHIGPVLLRDMIPEFELMDFRGTVRLCPCANPLALELDYEFYPEFEGTKKLDDYFYSRFRHDYEIYELGRQHKNNMNRVWNRGDLDSATSKITGWLWGQICVGSDAILDLHCLQDEKPLIFAIDTPENIKLASFFGIEAIYADPHKPGDEWSRGSLSMQTMTGLKIPVATIEFSRQHGYKKRDYEIGHRGILNTMKGLGMLDGKPEMERPVNVIREWFELKTEKTGHIHYFFDEYDTVKKGDVIFEISSVETLGRVQSPADGVMGRKEPWPVSSPARPVCFVLRAEVVQR